MTSEPQRDPAAVEIGSFFPHPPQAVWAALTEPRLVERWLMPSTGFEPVVGTHFIFAIPVGTPGEIACEVLTARPGEQLTFTWVDLRARYPKRWVADWAVRPQGRGTRMLVTQTGFYVEDKRQKMARNAMERVWRGALSRLGGVLDDGPSLN
ncbi:SRPBCC family protein [Nocardia thailandica]|uniref:SRPBCC domain-containing protein n=1 Tax=Nocardia thailandica TaxID=257275 RepID=A0ABW6PMG3_9NOCA|nr:SRPBCC domain-containing protein [Nocardia thailandica]